MSQSKFPAGWYEKRVQCVLTYYETQTEDETVAEDEVAYEQEGQTIMEIHQELVSKVRDVIAQHTHVTSTEKWKLQRTKVKKKNHVIM